MDGEAYGLLLFRHNTKLSHSLIATIPDIFWRHNETTSFEGCDEMTRFWVYWFSPVLTLSNTIDGNADIFIGDAGIRTPELLRKKRPLCRLSTALGITRTP